MVSNMAASIAKAGGYECEFVDPVKDFECPLCLYVTRDPNLTSCCGQHFCQVCINRILAEQRPCPFCKDRKFTVFLDKKQRRKISELQVYCTMKANGCSWTGDLGSLNLHIDGRNGNCQYINVTCYRGCGQTVAKRHLPHHLSKVCPKRDFTCEYCGFKSTYEEVCNKHWPECAKYPLPCPNKCGIAKVQRGFLEQHLNECPSQQVDCEFCHAGCEEKIQRKDLEEHMEQNLQKHLSMLSLFAAQRLAQNEKETAQLRTDMQNQLEEKDKIIDNLRYRVDNLEKVTLLQPVEFTMHNYTQYEGSNKYWNHGPMFYTHPMGYKVRVQLYFSGPRNEFDVELYHTEGEFDDKLQWPMRCILAVTVLNQRCDKYHLERFAGLELEKNNLVDLRIEYSEIRRTNGAQYLKDDCLRFRLQVKLQ